MKTPKFLFVITGAAVILRVAAALYMGDQVVELPGTSDQVTYHTLALRVINGYGFTFDRYWWPATAPGASTAHWSYLYTFYLIAMYTLFGPHPLAGRVMQAILVGILQPVLTYLITIRIFGWMFERQKERVTLFALAAAGINSIYTYFIYYSAALMTEPFYITSVMGSLYLAILCADTALQPPAGEKQATNRTIVFLLFGLVLSAAILLRQLYLLFVPFLFLWIGLRMGMHSLGSFYSGKRYILLRSYFNRYFLGMLLISSAVIAAVLLPFTVYNYARFQRFVLLNTNAGFAIFWANHPDYGTHFEPILSPKAYSQMIPPDLLGLDEAALDQALLRLGIGFILDDPARYAMLSLSRIPVYFDFWPSPQDGPISNVARVASFGLFLPFIIIGLARGWSLLLRRRTHWLPFMASSVFLITLFSVFYTALHILTWTLIRYRLPVDAALLPFAGFSLVELANWAVLKFKLKIPGWPLPEESVGEGVRTQIAP